MSFVINLVLDRKWFFDTSIEPWKLYFFVYLLFGTIKKFCIIFNIVIYLIWLNVVSYLSCVLWFNGSSKSGWTLSNIVKSFLVLQFWWSKFMIRQHCPVAELVWFIVAADMTLESLSFHLLSHFFIFYEVSDNSMRVFYGRNQSCRHCCFIEFPCSSPSLWWKIFKNYPAAIKEPRTEDMHFGFPLTFKKIRGRERKWLKFDDASVIKNYVEQLNVAFTCSAERSSLALWFGTRIPTCCYIERGRT